jgi:rRNA-processing protein FCF1
MPLLKSKRKPKRCNKPKSTYTNSDPESISCISTFLLQERHAILMTKQEQLESKIKEKSGIKFGAILPASEKVLEAEKLKIRQQLTEIKFDRKEH